MEGPMIPERHQKIRAVLEHVVKDKNIVGATLITRDGLCVVNGDEKILSPETFSAMTAALMGAAETAFFELGGANHVRVTAETEGRKMVALGANEELLLVIVGNGTSSGTALMQLAEATAAQLRTILAGG